MKYFWQVMRRFKVSFLLMVGFTIFCAVLDVYIPLQYLKLWNVLSANNFTAVASAKSLVIYILVLNIIRWSGRRINSFSNDYFKGSVMEGLRAQAFSYLIGHSHSFFANNFGGSLLQKISKYARAFEKLNDKMLTDGLPLLIRGIGIIIAVYTLIPKYSLMIGIFCFVFLTTAIIVTRYKLKYDVITALSDSKTTGTLADAIGNHASIQLFTGNKYEEKHTGEVLKAQKKATIFNWYLWDGLGSLLSGYVVAIEFIIFWIAIGDWKLGLITLPVFVLLQSYLGRLLENLWDFMGIVRTFYDAFADAQEMAIILDMPYEIKDESNKKLKNVKGEVAFKNVTYIYNKTRTNVLDDLSITVPAGQKIAFVGHSGAGKTTLVRLLMRLFDVTSGVILIDGIDISKVTQESTRGQIAFVPQDPILFHRTLMENIRYGRRDATDEEVKNAAHLAYCDEFIDRLPNSYNTFVGERGIKLSGGERQRVAIARAILKNAPILVLDEATSSLDSHSESLIQDALHNLIQGKTTIVIAHRLSTIREMDRIVVIEKGKLIEDGTHEDLVNKTGGLYKKLWDLQAGGFKARI